MTEPLWEIVLGARDGILATISEDGVPQLSNIYYLFDPSKQLVRFSTTSVRVKGRNILRDPRVVLHIPGKDFFNFAVLVGSASTAIARTPDDDAVDRLFAIHSGLGAAATREGFGEEMVANHRMAVEFPVDRIYGQVLDR